jgi:hypothetical protein
VAPEDLSAQGSISVDAQVVGEDSVPLDVKDIADVMIMCDGCDSSYHMLCVGE